MVYVKGVIVIDNILKLAEDLVENLKKSDVYCDFLNAKKNVDDNPELKEKILKYKKLNFEYQCKIMNEANVSFDEEKHISSMYHTLLLDAEAKFFLESEKKLVELLDRIYNIISGPCEIEMFD